MGDKYNEKLEADDQISAEEEIAAHLFNNIDMLSEGEAADFGREVLMMVLKRFRPDLIEGGKKT